MANEKKHLEDISTMVEILDEGQMQEDNQEEAQEKARKKRDLLAAVNKLKGEKEQENTPVKVEVPASANGQAPASTATTAQAGKHNYMETAGWFYSNTNSDEVNNKFQRAKDHLDYQEWDLAASKFKEILDIEPNNAGAAMGMFLAKEQMSDVKKLGECGRDIDVRNEKELMLAYADGNDGQKKFIEAALESRKKQNKYVEAAKRAGNFDDIRNLEKAEKLFIELGDYQDSESMAKRCRDGIRKIEITKEAGKAIAEGRDVDASLETVRNSVADLKAIRSANKDIVGNDLDKDIAELEQKLRQEERKHNTHQSNLKQSSIVSKWLTILAVIMLLCILPMGVVGCIQNYGALWFYKYFPLPYGAYNVAYEGEVPYIVGMCQGTLNIEYKGDYNVDKIYLPYVNNVSLVLSDGTLGSNAVFPEDIYYLMLKEYSVGRLEVPEGTTSLRLEGSKIGTLILPESLTALYLVGTTVNGEVIVPKGCSVDMENSTVGNLVIQNSWAVQLDSCEQLSGLTVTEELTQLEIRNETASVFSICGDGVVDTINGTDIHQLEMLDCSGVAAVESRIQILDAPILSQIILPEGSDCGIVTSNCPKMEED